MDRGIVLMAGEGIQAANLKQAYVSHSRFEESHITYTTDRRRAMAAMATPADRTLAVEVVNQRIRRWNICQKLIEQAEACAQRRRLWKSQRIKHTNLRTQHVTQTQEDASTSRARVR